MTQEAINRLATEAIAAGGGDVDGLCLFIQNRLGIPSGDVASIYWADGMPLDTRTVSEYIRTELFFTALVSAVNG